MGVTIKDIAKMLNVSHTTVSRALNDSPFINEETKKRVMKAVKQLNYVPNFNAKSLVLNKSYNIALFFSTISQGTSPNFFYDIIEGANSVIKESYNLVVKGIDEFKEFSFIDRQRFDGIILISQSESDNDFINYVLDKKIPLVVLNREVEDDSLINILTAEKEGSYHAVNYLIQNGHKHIAIIEGKKEFESSIKRKEGYIKALIENEMPINEEYMVYGEYDIESGYRKMKELLKLSSVPTAVFCFNDDMAVGAMKAIADAGLKVPEDISIIGFDDSVVCNYVTPSLTSVRKPSRELSVKGAEKLLELIDSKDCIRDKIYIEAKLVVRDSVKKLI